MKLNSFNYDEFLAEMSNRAEEITSVLYDLSPGEAAMYSFLFLPFFLVACLGILRLMGYEKGTRRIVVPVLALIYCASLTFMKIEGARSVNLNSAADQVSYYMVYSCLQNMDVERVCQGAGISFEKIEQLKEIRSKSFGVVDGRLHLKNPKMIELIKERMEELNTALVASVGNTEDVSVASIIEIAKKSNFGNLSQEVVEKVVLDHADQLEYHQSETGDFLTAVP